MKRSEFVFGASVLAATIGLGSCSRFSNSSGDTPSLIPATNVSQATSPMPGPTEQSDLWNTVTTSFGLTFSLPTTFAGPTAHDDWGFYAVSYDLNGHAGEPVQRIIAGGLGDKQSANGARQEVRDVNNLLIDGYIEINRLSWEQGGSSVVERVSFYHGDPSQNLLGCSWMVAQEDKRVVVLTLFGTYVDDGLRNGVEHSLAVS